MNGPRLNPSGGSSTRHGLVAALASGAAEGNDVINDTDAHGFD
jgi:hypothetical protein